MGNPRNVILEQNTTNGSKSMSSSLNRVQKSCKLPKSDGERSELIPPASDKSLDNTRNLSTRCDEKLLGSTLHSASSFSSNNINDYPELIFVDPKCENVDNSKHFQSNDHIIKRDIKKNGNQKSKNNPIHDQQVINMTDTNITVFSSRNCEAQSTINDHKQNEGSINGETFTNVTESEVLDNFAPEEVLLTDSQNDIHLEYLKAYNIIEESPKHSEVYPLCDYRIICQDKLHEIINCHKNILCSNSSVFKEIMNRNSLVEENVHISSLSSFTMKKLIESIYKKIPDKASMDIALLDAAVKYNVVSLLDVYKADLEEVLNLENVVDVILGAHRQNIEFYKMCAIDFMRKHWEQVKISSNIEKLKGHSDVLFDILLNIY